MTDAHTDPAYELSSRRAAVDAGRRAYRDAGPQVWSRPGRLTVEEAAARKATDAAKADVGTLSVGTVRTERTPRTDDPSAQLRGARLGTAFALVLFMLLIWIRQRRR